MESFDYASQANIIRVLNTITLFAGIGVHEQHMLADKCSIIGRKPEEIIVDQGEVGDSLYAIIKGTVLVSVKSPSSGWVRVNILTTGDVFGEIAILRNIPRTARISTQTACTFLTINAKDFLEVYKYFPANSRDNIQLIIEKRLAGLKFHTQRRI